MNGLAIDASICAAWCFTDERTPSTEAVLDAVVGAGNLVPAAAPRLWSYEVRNTVLMGVRRKRITAAHARAFLSSIDQLPVRLLDPPSFATVFDLADRHALTIYDAAYLDLALRERLKLATLDESLKRAATNVGVDLFSPSGQPKHRL